MTNDTLAEKRIPGHSLLVSLARSFAQLVRHTLLPLSSPSFWKDTKVENFSPWHSKKTWNQTKQDLSHDAHNGSKNAFFSCFCSALVDPGRWSWRRWILSSHRQRADEGLLSTSDKGKGYLLRFVPISVVDIYLPVGAGVCSQGHQVEDETTRSPQVPTFSLLAECVIVVSLSCLVSPLVILHKHIWILNVELRCCRFVLTSIRAKWSPFCRWRSVRRFTSASWQLRYLVLMPSYFVTPFLQLYSGFCEECSSI